MKHVRSAIAKGKELENWIVERLRLSGLDTRAYRQKGSGNGLNKGDIWNDLNICFEAKNTKNLALGATLKQVRREALGTQNPVIVWHPPHTSLEDSVVILDWHYYESLLLKVKNSTPAYQNPDRTADWALRNLSNAIKKVQKELNV
jgi:hypothetical protein